MLLPQSRRLYSCHETNKPVGVHWPDNAYREFEVLSAEVEGDVGKGIHRLAAHHELASVSDLVTTNGFLDLKRVSVRDYMTFSL